MPVLVVNIAFVLASCHVSVLAKVPVLRTVERCCKGITSKFYNITLFLSYLFFALKGVSKANTNVGLIFKVG